MPTPGWLLIVHTLIAVALLLFLILRVKLHAFLALLVASMELGLVTGMKPAAVLKSMQSGFGEALGFIAVVVGLGALIGRFLEQSGGGSVLADWLLGKFGKDRASWAVLTAAFLVGLPLFFEVGFIILAPVVWSLARESKRSLLYYGLPMGAALTMTHALVPPHPAPSAAAQLLGADLGRTILFGVLVSIPMAVVGGIVCGSRIARRVFVPVPAMAADVEQKSAAQGPVPAPPPVGIVLFLLLLPVALIFLATITASANVPAQGAFAFLGHPFSALLLTAFCAIVLFGVRRGMNRDQIARMTGEAFAPIGGLLLIIGGGGAFKQVIVDSGVGPYAGKLLAASPLSPLVVAYLVGAGLRIAQGSATVAIITAAGILAPLVKALSGYRPEFLVLAVCCGGTSFAHVNDAGFWLVNEYFGMKVPQTLKTWSLMKLIAGLTGFVCVLLLHAFIGR